MDIASFFQPTILLGNEKDKEKTAIYNDFFLWYTILGWFGMRAAYAGGVMPARKGAYDAVPLFCYAFAYALHQPLGIDAQYV